MKKFVHEFEDASEDGCLSFETDVEPPAQISMSVEKNGDVWLAANREGLLHLARVFAELALGNYEDGYHFHKSMSFQGSEGSPELSIEVRNEL